MASIIGPANLMSLHLKMNQKDVHCSHENYRTTLKNWNLAKLGRFAFLVATYLEITMKFYHIF